MRGRAIIKVVLQECAVSAEAFFGAGHPRHAVQARAEAIGRMNTAGMSNCAIARVMQRNPSTISYWLRPEWRQRRKDYYQRHWIDRRPPPRRPYFKVSPEQRVALLALLAAGNFGEVSRLQSAYGVSEKYTRELAARKRRAELGVDGYRSLPVLAPVRAKQSFRSHSRQTAEAGA